MLTTAHVKEMMVDSLHSPHDLADRLGLTPTGSQHEVLERFGGGEDPLMLVENIKDNTVKAVALCALWRMLNIPGSSCKIITSSKRMSSDFMTFLYEVTMKVDPALASVCRWPHWNVLQMGTDAGHEMRVISNKPKWVEKPPTGVTTLVILGAASSSLKFCATREVFERHADLEGVRLVSVW